MLPSHEPPRQLQGHVVPHLAIGAGGTPTVLKEVLGDVQDPHTRFSSSAVPNRSSLTMPGGLPFGFVTSPFAAQEDSSKWLRRDAERCQSCGAVRNLYVAVETQTGRWACNFCSGINTNEDLKGQGGIEACRELRDAVIEYAPPSATAFATAEYQPKTHLFVVDTTIRAKDLADLKETVVYALQALHSNDLIGLVAFDSVVRVYDLSKRDAASAHILSGTHSPSAHDLNALGSSGGVLTAPVHAAAAIFIAIVKSLKPPVRAGARGRAKLRCVGPAVETAVAIAAASAQPRAGPSQIEGVAPGGGKARATVFMGGPATRGPGALGGFEGSEDGDEASGQDSHDYYALVGERARRLGVVIDAFIVSLTDVGMPLLQGMCAGSGGEAVPHASFAGALAESLTRATLRSVGASGVLDVHCSPAVQITRVLGPLVPPSTREESEMAEDLPNLAMAPAVEARHGFTVLYHLREDIDCEYLYFQVVSAHTTPFGQRIMRTSTHRVSVTGNTAQLLSTVDVGVVGVLLAKEAVVEVREGSATREEARMELNGRLQNIAQTWSDQVRVTASGRMATLPTQLSGLPGLIFQAQHGPLLGAMLNDEDDAQAARQAFLAYSLDDSLRLLAPPLLSYTLDAAAAEPYVQVPLEDLSLLPSRLLLLDHHTHVFIWSGADVGGPEHAAARERARADAAAWTAARFPAPEVMELREGESMARWLVCRLNPAHRDVSASGMVGAVTGAVRSMFSSRFSHTDDDSMNEWLAKLRIAP